MAKKRRLPLIPTLPSLPGLPGFAAIIGLLGGLFVAGVLQASGTLEAATILGVP